MSPGAWVKSSVLVQNEEVRNAVCCIMDCPYYVIIFPYKLTVKALIVLFYISFVTDIFMFAFSFIRHLLTRCLVSSAGQFQLL